MNKQIRGVAKFGIALGSGPRGRGFESRHSDQNPQIFVQEAQKSEDSSFAKPWNLCETPTPGNAEKSDYRSDYLAEMLTRSRRSKEGQNHVVLPFPGFLFPLFPLP